MGSMQLSTAHHALDLLLSLRFGASNWHVCGRLQTASSSYKYDLPVPEMQNKCYMADQVGKWSARLGQHCSVVAAGGTDLAVNLFSSAFYVSKAKTGLEQCPWFLQLLCCGFPFC